MAACHVESGRCESVVAAEFVADCLDGKTSSSSQPRYLVLPRWSMKTKKTPYKQGVLKITDETLFIGKKSQVFLLIV